MEKGGLLGALLGAGLASGAGAWHSDEMRLGLRGQTRKVLAPKGAKEVVQPLQVRYEWSYLVFLAVSPLTGEIRWEWIERMRQEHLRPVLERWNLEVVVVVVWDRAPSHRAKSLRKLPTKRVFLPPYSPELDPAERIFEEVRRRVEEGLRGPRGQAAGSRKLPPRASGRSRAGQELVWLGVAAGSAPVAADACHESVMCAILTQNRY